MPDTPSASLTRTVVIDLGDQKRKHVKRLRKGKGALLADVRASIAGLKAAGVLAPDAHPVIMIVRERGSKKKGTPDKPRLVD